MYDPTRIKYPLKRVGERGTGRWKRVSWDQALTEIADAMLEVLTADGPEAIVFGAGTQGEGNNTADTACRVLCSELGITKFSEVAEEGDDHQGAWDTFGTSIVGDSPDNWYYADLILIWGGNPTYTNITNYHYLTTARYNGTRVVTIAPDVSPSAMHADLWVPVNIGTDPALALAMAQVLIEEKLYREGFVKEQTDLPLLVRQDTGKLLRQSDLRRGGREDVFYFYDLTTRRVVEAPRTSLTLNGMDPALEREYTVEVAGKKVTVEPVMALLRRQLDLEYRPEQAARVCGTSPGLIRHLAQLVGRASGVVNISTANWGKFYHGDLIERAIILVFALCGHIGRRGAGYNAFPALGLDTLLGSLMQRGDHLLLSAAANDPRIAGWRQDGYTDEMILYEYAREAFSQGALASSSMLYYLHGGLLELSEKHGSWDPHLRRPVAEYVREALDKGWQFVVPGPGKAPRILFNMGGNFIRRGRATQELVRTLLPKLRLLVSIDFRMNSTALYADYVLPAAGWYERCSIHLIQFPQNAYVHLADKAVEPMYDSKSEWEIWCLLARKLQERAAERGIASYLDGAGRERRLDRLYEKVTFNGLYEPEDDEAVTRDTFVNTANVEPMSWEEFKERGVAALTHVGMQVWSIGNACDLVPGEPIVPLTWHTEKKQPYPTLTRRIQFYIDQDLFLELGEALPVQKEDPRAGGDYPLRLTGGHARWSVHSIHVDSALLLRLQRGEPLVFLSAADARARGIADGNEVEVRNDLASFRIRAAVSPAVRPGQVIIYHAWENFQFRGWRHFKSVMAAPLNPVELAGDYFHIRPITLGCCPGLSDRETRVEIKRV
jgi:DMSO reductase family type II enzyme molybdopterin subunit